MEGAARALARLNTLLMTLVPCQRADESERVRGHRQNMSHKTVSMDLPILLAHLSQKSGPYVEDWCPEKFTASSLSVHQPEVSASDRITRTARGKVVTPT